MSNTGDHGSWNPQGHEPDAQQPPQDPWAQPPASQDPYGQSSADAGQAGQYGQQDPYGQSSADAGQAGQYGQQDPYGQSSADAGQAGQYGQQDPYSQGQQNWTPAPGSAASAADPSAGGSPYGAPAAAGAPGPAGQGEAQSRVLVGVLGIFFGAFGVHRFLMGYTAIGLVQVLVTVLSCFTLSPITTIWGLVEGIMVLAKSPSFERDAHGRPLRD